ncbi:MAG TPA: hypothetical protein GX526_06070 [Thermoanaerobacterales bacterium]|nr:hypothetical protein [Thermoanaerobacterales bacterium]
MITAKPSGENISEISKSGSPNATINAKEINWVIDVNTVLDDLKDAEVTDVIPDGLELVHESIEIYKLRVGHKGKLTEVEGNIANEFDISKITEPDGFEIEFGDINDAYRIKYKTKIKDYLEDGYTNKATLISKGKKIKDVEFKIDKIDRGSLIEKSSPSKTLTDASKISWQIDVNKAQENLTDVYVRDKIPEGLELNLDDIKICSQLSF